MKCNICNKFIARDNESYVTCIQGAKPAPRGIYRPKPQYQHARCFEQSVIFNYESRKRDDERNAAILKEAGL